MRKALFILLPVLVLGFLAGRALTEQDHDIVVKTPEKMRTFSAGGYRLGVVLSEKSTDGKGVEVTEVIEDSPAEKAGIKEGDILLRIDDKEISNATDIRRYLKGLTEEKKVSIDLVRDGKEITVQAAPDKRTTMKFIRAFGRGYLGVDLQELNPDLAAYFQVDPKAGVLVTRVDKDSPAEKAGLKAGDVITSFNGKKTTTPDDVRKELRELEEGDAAKLTVLRHGKEQQITAKPEKRTFPHLEELPEMPHLRELQDLPDFHFDMEEMKQQLEDLKQELEKDLKPEMEKLKKELEKLRKESA